MADKAFVRIFGYLEACLCTQRTFTAEVEPITITVERGFYGAIIDDKITHRRDFSSFLPGFTFSFYKIDVAKKITVPAKPMPDFMKELLARF